MTIPRAPLALLLLAACTATTDPPTTVDAGGWTRDWDTHPAVVTLDSARVLWAVSDLHGGYARTLALLQGAGLVDAAGAWTGADAVLVVNGDLIDKGPQSVAVVDLLRALEPAAAAAGGRVITLLGNHEASFLANPDNDKAESLQEELATRGVSPTRYASSDSDSGRFLRSLPIAARVNGWFFCHAGTSGGRTLEALATLYRAEVDANRWASDFLAATSSPLEAERWWSTPNLARDRAALGAKHLVMGHDPGAFDEEGTIAAHFAGALVHIDTGLSPAVNLSTGRALRVDAPGTEGERAWSVDPSGAAAEVDLTRAE